MSKKLKVLAVLLLVVMISSVFAGCSTKQTTKPEEKIKVAFIYVGPKNDGGWTQAHDDGRLYLEQQLPYVQT
ncbi:MAG: BMP family ABC transporter substrate-binding protein, partial [Caldisericaceae bacterium]